jgi:crotonobetainyl-CoA:carnitine CoA-transferase CaiB-like acyl-CoA transferase
VSHSALSGIKVLEFSEFISGPYCGKMLSNMGAEVLKLEKPGFGDRSRSYGPFPEDLPHPEKSGLFLFLNTNKSSVTLNLETATGLKIFKELLGWADVLIEDHLPKELVRLGLSYRVIHKINPSLIMTSITPFGQTGPFRNYKGCDLVHCNSGSNAFGNPDEGVQDPDTHPPLKTPSHGSDIIGGITGAVCTMGAVIGRNNRKSGIHVDVSQQEAVASMGRQQLAFYSVQGLTPSREYGRKKFGGFLYPCQDGHVVIWIGPHYPLVVKMMGNPDWAEAEMFANPLMRNDYISELNQLISVWTLEHTTEEINSLALQHGVPCSLVRNVKDLIFDKQLEYRHFWEEVEHSVAGKLKYPGPPFKLSATPGKIERPAPLLGEQNEKVYCQMLGYSRGDLVQMRQIGVI